MRKYLSYIVPIAVAVLLVGITAIKAYEAMQTFNVAGDAYITYEKSEAPSDMLGSGTIVNPRSQSRAVYSGEPFDILGSRTGTTTTGVYFGAPTASSTYPILLSPISREGVFTIGVVNASTTPGGLLTMTILASNDVHCDTATTTTTMDNVVVTGDINWFDAGNYVRNSATVTTLTSATSTISFAPTARHQNRQIFLEGLNSRCIALEITGSSTEAWIQFKQTPTP